MSSSAPCTSITVNCSRPDTTSLLEALRPVFNLRDIRPVMNISTTTNVNINFILFGIWEVNEKAQLLTTFIWQYLEWRNEFVEWDPEQCGSSRIAIPRKLLWVPDIVINEFMDKNSAPFVPYSYLFSNGWILDEQPVKVVSSCRINTYAFPFDIQNCSLSFNCYIHLMADVYISRTFSAEDMFRYSKKVMTTVGEWELVGLTGKTLNMTSTIGKPYQEIRFFVSVRRRASMYVVNLLVPSCLLAIADLFSFLLPPMSASRSYFKITLILGYTVFLNNINDLLPVSGNDIPVINMFLCLSLALMVVSLLETILLTNLLGASIPSFPVPHLVRVLVLHILGYLVCLPPKPRHVMDTVIPNPAIQETTVSSEMEKGSEAPEFKSLLDDSEALQELRTLGRDLQDLHVQLEQQLGESQSSEEWIRVGRVVDRLMFGLYIVIISVSFITMVAIWIKSYSQQFL
ncbi:uncharacterized protein V6R79_001225 [Siganus canaliculatus]